MSDRLFYPFIILVMAAVVALAAVWPQGNGARSPGPFGHQPVQQQIAAPGPQPSAAAAPASARPSETLPREPLR